MPETLTNVAASQREREDKYEADERFTVPRLEELAPTGGRVEQDRVVLDSLYFDTPAHDLLRNRVTLRRRDGDTDTGWQLKVPEGKARSEIRLPATDDETVPARLGELTQGIAAGRPLQRVALLRTNRMRHRIVAADGTTLFELADDHVRATAFGESAKLTRWREIEVELGAGREADLAQLGKRLTRAGARPSEHRSKLARALGSDDPAQPGVVADYLRQQHAELVAGDVSLRRGHDAIHATRVATRRLRSTLRVFGDLFDERRAADLDRELAWYADVLGEVRDRQVQRARFAKAFSALPPELVLGPVAADVDQRLHGDQMRYQAELNAALRTDRYVRLLEDVREWSAAPPLVRRHNAPAVQRLARRARRKADKRLAQALATPEGRRGDEALHRARKAAKRARYAVELTAPIRKRKSAKRIIKRYKALQDILGEHQDSVLAAELLRDLAARDGSAPGHNGFTYGLLYCREQQAARQTRRDAAKWPNG